MRGPKNEMRNREKGVSGGNGASILEGEEGREFEKLGHSISSKGGEWVGYLRVLLDQVLFGCRTSFNHT